MYKLQEKLEWLQKRSPTEDSRTEMGGSTVQQKIKKLNLLTDHNPSSFGFWGVVKNVSHK